MRVPGKSSVCRLLARLWFNHKLLGNVVLMALLLLVFGSTVMLLGLAVEPWWSGSAATFLSTSCTVALLVIGPLMGWGFMRFMAGLERVPSDRAHRVQALLSAQGLSTQSHSRPSRMEAWLASEGFESARRAQERASQLESALPSAIRPSSPKPRF